LLPWLLCWAVAHFLSAPLQGPSYLAGRLRGLGLARAGAKDGAGGARQLLIRHAASETIKRLQSNSLGAAAQWKLYCDAYADGETDLTNYPEDFKEAFLDHYNEGYRLSTLATSLLDLLEASPSLETAWSSHCQREGFSTIVSTKATLLESILSSDRQRKGVMDEGFIRAFVDSIASGEVPSPRVASSPVAGVAKAAPPPSGDGDKEELRGKDMRQLVGIVQDFLRQAPDHGEIWAGYVKSHGGDDVSMTPANREKSFLEDFLAAVVPSSPRKRELISEIKEYQRAGGYAASEDWKKYCEGIAVARTRLVVDPYLLEERALEEFLARKGPRSRLSNPIEKIEAGAQPFSRSTAPRSRATQPNAVRNPDEIGDIS